MRVVREGVVGGLALLAVGAALGRFGGWPLSVPWLLLACAVLYFFRDPDRTVPDDPHLAVAPADGKVTSLEKLPADGEFHTRVSIFLGLRDVHVIRSPIGGRVTRVAYTRGRFIDAEHPMAHVVNEQNRVRIEDGVVVVEMVQIAGLLARRIVCWLEADQAVQRGQRVGLIRFGSRADVYLPKGAVILVEEGARVRAGADPIARLNTLSP